MFDFLNKPTHHHLAPPPTIQYKKPELERNEPSIMVDSINSSIRVSSAKKQIKQTPIKTKNPKKYQQPNPFGITPYIQTLFAQMFNDSRNLVNDKHANKVVVQLSEILNEQIQMIQKRVYARQTATNQSYYLHQLFQKVSLPNALVKQGLDDLISGTVQNITGDIENSKSGYEVFKKKIMTKQDLIQMQKMDQIRMIQLKQGEITSKVGELRMELNIIEDPYISNKAKQIVQKQSYNKNSEKTKQAQKFVQIKRFQREQAELKKQQNIDRKKLKQLQEKVQTQVQHEKAKSQRHARLIQKLQAKKILKQKREDQVQTQKHKFTRFLKEYKKAKPLFQQKLEEQFKRQIEERKQRFQKMAQRKNEYNPLNLEELQDFESKYLELKREFQEKKQIQKQIRRDEQKYRVQEMKDKYYKGKYRYLILQELVNKQANKQQEQFKKNSLIQKKRAYSVDVKQKHKPKIDENKKLESEQFIAKTQRKIKQKGLRRVRINSSDPNNYNTISYEEKQQYSQPDPKRQGHKNMRLFKQYIHEKIQRGEIKRPESIQSQISFTPQIDYLKVQRQNRETKHSSFSYHSLDAESRIRKIKQQSNGDMSLFKFKADELDEKARRQELKLKYSEHTPNDQKQLEDNYLASIKAKMELLNNCK